VFIWLPSVKKTNSLTILLQIAPYTLIDTLPLLKDSLRFFSKYSSLGLHVTQIFLLSLPTSKVTSSIQITFFQSSFNQSLYSLYHSYLDCFWASVMNGFFLAFLRFIWVFLRIFQMVGWLICLPAVLEGVPRVIIGKQVSDMAAHTKSHSPLAEIFGGYLEHFLLARDSKFFLNQSRIDYTVLQVRSSSWVISERDFSALCQVITVERFAIECSFLVIAIVIFLIYITSDNFSYFYIYFPVQYSKNAEICNCIITLLLWLYFRIYKVLAILTTDKYLRFLVTQAFVNSLESYKLR
jgi:hypothetical protein